LVGYPGMGGEGAQYKRSDVPTPPRTPRYAAVLRLTQPPMEVEHGHVGMSRYEKTSFYPNDDFLI
jgi:hypothetical protein